MNKIQKLLFANPQLKLAQGRLLSHPIYASLTTHADFKLFMERHCWAVWDFMLLLKELQRKLTNTRRFWTPAQDHNAARFIHQIVIGEETDVTDVQGEHMPHFELYIKGMEEVGANTVPIRNFVKRVAALTDKEDTYADIERLVLEADSPDYVKRFNLNTCASIFKPVSYTAGQFLFGREDPIPQMFSGLVASAEKGNIKCPTLNLYLKRHIEVDGDDHGPKSVELIQNLSRRYDPECTVILQGACEAIDHRIKLWDGILEEVKTQKRLSVNKRSYQPVWADGLQVPHGELHPLTPKGQ